MDVRDTEHHRMVQELNHLREALKQAEADRDALAAEVRAWRAADKYHHLRMTMEECWASTHREDVEKAMDSSNDGALDRAKEAE